MFNFTLGSPATASECLMHICTTTIVHISTWQLGIRCQLKRYWQMISLIEWINCIAVGRIKGSNYTQHTIYVEVADCSVNITQLITDKSAQLCRCYNTALRCSSEKLAKSKLLTGALQLVSIIYKLCYDGAQTAVLRIVTWNIQCSHGWKNVDSAQCSSNMEFIKIAKKWIAAAYRPLDSLVLNYGAYLSQVTEQYGNNHGWRSWIGLYNLGHACESCTGRTDMVKLFLLQMKLTLCLILRMSRRGSHYPNFERYCASLLVHKNFLVSVYMISLLPLTP